MAAPIPYYVNNSGSIFRINDKEIDLELVTSIGTKPTFPGSGSIKETSFDIIINSKPITINNSEAVKFFNKENYKFPNIITSSYNLNQALNIQLRYSSSVNKLVVYPQGNFVYSLTNYYGLTQSNVSKSFYNSTDGRKHNFNSSAINYISDPLNPDYGYTLITPNTSSLGTSSTGSITITNYNTEYRYSFISASLDIYNNFLSLYNQFSSSLKFIKGSINA